MSGPVIFNLVHYVSRDGEDVYESWLDEVEPRDADRIDAYVSRMAWGNFGSSRSVGDGVLELKMNMGPGYRVYYLREGGQVVVLLCGGDKHSQAKDILKAKVLSMDYWRRQ